METSHLADLAGDDLIILYGPSRSGKSRLTKILTKGSDLSVCSTVWTEGDPHNREALWLWTKCDRGPGWYLTRKHRDVVRFSCEFESTGDPLVDHLIVDALWKDTNWQTYRIVFQCVSEVWYDRLRTILPQAQAFKLIL